MIRLFRELHRRSRVKKYRMFMDLMRPMPGDRILNVGTTGSRMGFWEQLEHWYPHPDRITGGGLHYDAVLDYQESFPAITAVVFDGCCMPFPDKSFDIVYSNAVIEHLPGPDAVARFASEVQRVGKGWFISTPNYWYPIEPHYHLPYLQLLPQRWQHRVAANLGKPTYEYLQLLERRDMTRLFPTSEVVGCRVTFYPETLIACRRPDSREIHARD
jgi:SAM-dependent methyltransferase